MNNKIKIISEIICTYSYHFRLLLVFKWHIISIFSLIYFTFHLCNVFRQCAILLDFEVKIEMVLVALSYWSDKRVKAKRRCLGQLLFDEEMQKSEKGRSLLTTRRIHGLPSMTSRRIIEARAFGWWLVMSPCTSQT